MKVAESIKNFIIKLRGLPDSGKKAIIISIAVVFGLGLGTFWLNSTINTLSNIENVDLGNFDTSELSTVELPDIGAMVSAANQAALEDANQTPIDNTTTPN